MIVHKYLSCFAGKYSLLTPHLRCARNVSLFRLAREKRESCYPLPIATSDLSLTKINTTFSSSCFYSQAANPEQVTKKSSSIAHNIQPIKFEEMSFEPPVTHEHLCEELRKCESIAEQMEKLSSTLALSADDIEKRFKFCKQMESLFRPFFNNFKIQMFGSTVNCFGFKGCDIDMTFETSAECKNQTIYIDRPDIPLVSEVTSGKVSPEEISELPYKEQLLFMHTVLLEYYNESEASTIFINAHVPLVRFYHDKYGLKCDLTFKNKVAYANTKLLYLYAKLDQRVIPLMMTVRYWAKHTELIGKGLMFNTYTFTLLVIYFLQSRAPPVLPSAEFILSLSNSFEMDDMTDKSFLNILDDIPPTQNTQTSAELLKEFFFFYLYFDFTRVICPLTGKAVPREEFFPLEENRKFRMNTICVQDPLCLPHNVAELTDYKTCRKFYAELTMTCKMFQENENSSSHEGYGLITLFDKPKKFSIQNVNGQKLFSLTVPLVLKTGSDENSEFTRASVTAGNVMKILEHALLFEHKLLKIENAQKLLKKQDELIALQKKQIEAKNLFQLELSKLQKKPKKIFATEEDESNETMLEQFQKLNDESELVLCTHCKVTNNTWLGRELVEADVSADTSHNLLERERFISVQTAKQNEKNAFEKKAKRLSFLCECYISRNNPDHLLVNFRPLQKMSFNAILGVFLKEYIPKVMKKINMKS